MVLADWGNGAGIFRGAIFAVHQNNAQPLLQDNLFFCNQKTGISVFGFSIC
ncbi:MAG: hypothetical protein KKE83_13325 [Proteobacteria bacterium]|nr:hypothetical protein [Pseudomonadota bacterium]MBU1545501.1 hypothetical protein [Pseudomonadota bacterium]MBU2620652.1 hypothetical protein [Pseudomonadota bacterium]